MTATVHLVDDDAVLREFIGGYLSGVGFEVRSFDSVAAFRAAAVAGLPDIVITDLVMPGEDGLSLLSWLRGFSQVPVIMLTSQDATTDRVVGLELGADDYLAKPCEPRELLACVRSQLRRLKATRAPLPSTNADAGTDAGPVVWHFAGRSLDERALELRVHGARVELPKKPLEVLMYFLRHAGEVVGKDQLLAAVWPGRIVSETALTNAIGKLRAALADEQQTLIKAVYGYGYRFEIKPERSA